MFGKLERAFLLGLTTTKKTAARRRFLSLRGNFAGGALFLCQQGEGRVGAISPRLGVRAAVFFAGSEF